ncbi:MAG: M48 family metalloprotease [Rickettsiales bacterium]|jgi:hypothetical protein|nr:M48 family metalloprotease [Rickettsiales bacterium]
MILTQEQIEQVKMIDSELPASKLIAAKMRDIVMKLMSESGLTNLANMDFILVDMDAPNAFYVPPRGTTNGREAVAVSTAMVAKCQNEDEFAGVLAHEMGHFIYDKTLKGENTLPQERAADLHAMDLMIDGGYNPENYEGLAQRLFLDKENSRGAVLDSIGVHGSPYARVEDVRAYLTILDLKNGRAKTADGDWADFQKQFDGMLAKGRYKSYLDKLLDGATEHAERLGRILDNLFDISTGVRIADLNAKLGEWIEAREKGVELEPGAMAAAQNLAVAIYNQTQMDENSVWARGRYPSDFPSVAVIKNLSSLRGRPLDLFGPFAEYAAVRRQFIDSDTPEAASAAAKRYSEYELELMKAYSYAFGEMPRFPGFPKLEDAIGWELPYARHLRWAADDADIARFMEKVFDREPIELNGYAGNQNFIYENDGYSGTTMHDVYFRDGVIVALGKEARAMNAEDKDDEWLRSHIEANRHIIRRRLAALDVLTDIESGRIDVYKSYDGYNEGEADDEKAKKVESVSGQYTIASGMEHDRQGGFLRMLLGDNYHSTARTAAEDAADLKELRAARGFAILDNPIPFADEISAKTDGDKIKILTSPGMNTEYARRVAEILSAALSMPSKYGRVIAFAKLYDAVDNIQLSKSFGSEEQRADLKKELSDELNKKISANMKAEKAKILDKLRDDFCKVATPLEYFDGLDYKMGLKNEALGGRTEHIDAAFAKLVGKMPATQPELISAIKKIRGGVGNGNKSQQDPIHDRAIAFLIWRYLGTGGKIENFSEMVLTANIDAGYMGGHPLKDAVADAIGADGFPAGDLKLYAEMDRWGWFSERRANQSRILDQIIGTIETLPRPGREKKSMQLLTGDYDGAGTGRKETSMRFPDQKERLYKIFSDAVRERIGPDDDSEKYRGELQKILDDLDRPVEYKESYGGGATRARMNLADRGRLFRVLSDRLQTLERASDLLKSGQELVVGDADAQRYDSMAQAFEVFLAGLQDKKGVSAAFDFLNNPLTPESMDEYRAKMKELRVVHPSDIEDKFSNAAMEFAHRTFWTTGIAGRAYLTGKILNRYSSDINEQTQYVCDMRFPEGAKYRDQAQKIFKAVIGALPDYKKNLTLAAIASAGQTDGAEGAGAGLRMFFENMGPAWIKFGQLLSYAPNLPEDIRADLAKLKDGADIPARWELFDMIAKAVPDKLRGDIESVGEIMGAGSFWITARMRTAGGDRVVSLLRPNAAARSETGFAEISGAIKTLAADDARYKSLGKIAEQARKNALDETDIDKGFAKYERAAGELYKGVAVKIDGDEFRPNVAEWLARGKGYKIMSLAEGRALGKIDDPAERKKMALGYLAIELAVLLKGGVWDIDRHQGQQNFAETAPGKYAINIFDTGAQTERAPGKREKFVMANLLFDIAAAAKNGRKLSDQIMENIEKAEQWEEKYKIPAAYAAEVQKGLMALSDIIEYNKQPPMRLDGADLENALRAVLDAPGTDKILAGVLKARALPGAAITAVKNIGRPRAKNPVEIVAPAAIVTDDAGELPEKKSARFDKSAAEVHRLKLEQASERILGFRTRQIRPASSPANPPDAQSLALHRRRRMKQA